MRRGPTLEFLVPVEIARLPPAQVAAAMTVTIADIAEWERLGGVCPRCNRHGLINTYRLKRRYADRNLLALQANLPCAGCKNRTGNLFVMTKIPRD